MPIGIFVRTKEHNQNISKALTGLVRFPPKKFKDCTKCKIKKPAKEFRKYRNTCKKCEVEYGFHWNRVHKKHQHNWYLKNKLRLLKRRKEYYLETKEHTLEIARKWMKNNKLKRKEYIKKWRKTNLKNRITDCLRARIRAVIKNNRKSAHTMKLIGCSIEFFKQHLEKQFTSGMTWDNYGKIGWEVDHMRPCASFDLSNPEEQKICFHYTNLQPLWALDNLKKGDKYVKII